MAKTGGFIGAILSLMIMAVVVVQVFLPTVKDANTTSFTAGELALWSLASFVAIAGFVYSVGQIFGIL